jgi:hypothetical protein
MTEGILTTYDVRETFRFGMATTHPKTPLFVCDEKFDRWLAAHDKEIRAEQDAAIQRVRELHLPIEAEWMDVEGYRVEGEYCDDCGNTYPCPTIKALESE